MFLFLVYFLIEVQAKGHVCESTEIINFDEVSVFGKITCNLNDNTEISEDGDTILNRDDSMGALEFSRNKKIRHLPIYIKDVYANLAVLAASGCLLTEVSYNTLVGLNKLQVLWLYDNQINHIEPKTFKDLTSLKAVDLSKQTLFFCNIRQLDFQLFCRLQQNSNIEWKIVRWVEETARCWFT